MIGAKHWLYLLPAWYNFAGFLIVRYGDRENTKIVIFSITFLWSKRPQKAKKISENLCTKRMIHWFFFKSYFESAILLVCATKTIGKAPTMLRAKGNDGEESGGGDKNDSSIKKVVTKKSAPLVVPKPFDVLLGRGKSNHNHPGNQRYEGKHIK